MLINDNFFTHSYNKNEWAQLGDINHVHNSTLEG